LYPSPALITRIETVTAAPPLLTEEVRTLDLQEAWHFEFRVEPGFEAGSR
jgi:hypothetical protein